MRSLLPIYAIRVSAIQELRCVPGNTLSFEGIIGRLIAFELSNFDNYKPKNFESAFKAKMTIKDNKEVQTNKKVEKESMYQVIVALMKMKSISWRHY